MLARLIALCCLTFIPVAAAAVEYKTMEVLPDIYAWTPRDGVAATSVFIVTAKGVVVIDTGGGPAAGRALHKAIREVTALPVAYVINTHYHGENTFGNQAFADAPTILAQENAAKALLGAPGRRAQKRFQREHPGSGLKRTAPNLVFATHLGLRVGKYFLKLIHPKFSHTSGDVYIYIPAYRLIITGGLVNRGLIPDLDEAIIEEWILALRTMEDLDAEIIVPGHGKPGGKPAVTLMKHYLMELKRHVMDELREGGSLPAIQKTVRAKLQAKYGSWKRQDRLDLNIERAFHEFIGKP
ncbi:MAG: MBL fold metallo-hydrolase [Nitrospinaceae bacterium]